MGRGESSKPDFAQLNRLSDEEVMLHLKAGVDDALAVLFLRYHRMILSISTRILRDRGEAEDCAQSIFFEIFRSAAQFDPARGTTRTWVVQFAYHRSINRKRYLRHREFYSAHEASDSDFLVEGQESGTANVYAQVDARKMLDGVIEGLTSEQRKTIEMAYFEGLTLREIAESTGESLGNVRHHYYRGLRRLRSLLNGQKEPSGPDSLNREVIDAEA